MSKPARQLRPSRSVTVGALGGSPLGIIVVWALMQAGLDVPPEVAAAIGTTVGALVGYIVKGGRV
mgnify:CR=1 FL=1